ncbi:hypothetical protein KOE73_16205, partial [Acidomonas methanolica]|nr:hypothetical protein [Acidomonas methanolica]
MTTYTWTGEASHDWNTARNWSPSGVPGQNDTVDIGSSSESTDYSVTINSRVTVGTVNVYTGDTLTVNSEISANNINLSGGAITFASASSGENLSVNVTSGTLNIDSSSVTFNNIGVSGGTIALNGISGYSLENCNVSGNGILELNDTTVSSFSGSSFNNNASIILNEKSSLPVSNLGTKVTLNGGSTLVLSGNYNGGASVVVGTGTGNTILLSNNASQSNISISNVASGDLIGISGEKVTSSTYTNTNGKGSITLTTSSGTVTYSDVTFASDVPTGTHQAGLENGDAVICFLAGSMIRTPGGDVTVEDIRIGDE